MAFTPEYTPNVYTCQIANTASTANSNVMTFGFPPKWIHIHNSTISDLFVNFQNGIASTTGYSISSCVGNNVLDYYDNGGARPVLIAGIGLTTTSTAAAGSYRVLAIG